MTSGHIPWLGLGVVTQSARYVPRQFQPRLPLMLQDAEYDDSVLVTCDMCGVTVHTMCYGLSRCVCVCVGVGVRVSVCLCVCVFAWGLVTLSCSRSPRPLVPCVPINVQAGCGMTCPLQKAPPSSPLPPQLWAQPVAEPLPPVQCSPNTPRLHHSLVAPPHLQLWCGSGWGPVAV